VVVVLVILEAAAVVQTVAMRVAAEVVLHSLEILRSFRVRASWDLIQRMDPLHRTQVPFTTLQV
jgi:hypothetical protein